MPRASIFDPSHPLNIELVLGRHILFLFIGSEHQ